MSSSSSSDGSCVLLIAVVFSWFTVLGSIGKTLERVEQTERGLKQELELLRLEIRSTAFVGTATIAPESSQ